MANNGLTNRAVRINICILTSVCNCGDCMNSGNGCCSELSSLLSVDLFKALGDSTRVSILAGLAAGGRTQTVSEVAECCPVNVSVVSRHLKVLERAGVLESEKRGKEVFYHVRTGYLAMLLRRLADAIESCCPEGTVPLPTEQENKS